MMGGVKRTDAHFLSEISMVYCYVSIPAAELAIALARTGEGDDIVIEAGRPGTGLTVHPHPRGGGTWWLWG